jgi:hypothetical protein
MSIIRAILHRQLVEMPDVLFLGLFDRREYSKVIGDFVFVKFEHRGCTVPQCNWSSGQQKGGGGTEGGWGRKREGGGETEKGSWGREEKHSGGEGGRKGRAEGEEAGRR